MEFEQMREILARGMGWEKRVSALRGDSSIGWHEPYGARWGWAYEIAQWRPDENPKQMLEVVDSLDKDWFLHVWINEGGQSWTCEAAHGDSKDFGFGKFCEAICMAIAHVREMEDNDAVSV